MVYTSRMVTWLLSHAWCLSPMGYYLAYLTRMVIHHVSMHLLTLVLHLPTSYWFIPAFWNASHLLQAILWLLVTFTHLLHTC